MTRHHRARRTRRRPPRLDDYRLAGSDEWETQLLADAAHQLEAVRREETE